MPFPSLPASLAQALARRGYEEPTPVQEAVLSAAAEHGARDLLVSAQTGSGKTVAYALAAVPPLLDENGRLPAPRAPLMLVIAPTRELAIQTTAELGWLLADAGGRVVSCIGGMDIRREARALAAGCHVVVGTPGRLCDHLSRGRLDTAAIAAVVLDEADEMLDLGFKDELEQILDALPQERRTLLFSATIARDIANLAKHYQRDALRIDTTTGAPQHADIAYRAVMCAPDDVEHAVVNVLRWFESPISMVFCSTREMVRHMQSALLERGFSSVALSGELSQNERTRALDALRAGGARVCVATDVAARGIDLPALGLVIHAALPADSATLLHRSGRTGRAGRKGTSVLLVPASRRRKAEQLLGAARLQAHWSSAPTADEIRDRDGERLLTDPLLSEEPAPEDTALIERLAENRSAAELAAALLRLHRAQLPDPEELRPLSVRPPRPVAQPGGEYAEAGRRERPRAERVTAGNDGVWFALPIGRRDRADPKWLVPLICRLGGVTKREIGLIRIGDGETRFEIAPGSAERFASCTAGADDDEPRISRSAAPGDAGAPRSRAPQGAPPRRAASSRRRAP